VRKEVYRNTSAEGPLYVPDILIQNSLSMPPDINELCIIKKADKTAINNIFTFLQEVLEMASMFMDTQLSSAKKKLASDRRFRMHSLFHLQTVQYGSSLLSTVLAQTRRLKPGERKGQGTEASFS
jgi:hypothetical protein